MIGEDTGRDDDPRSRCSLIGSGVGVYIFILMYYIEDIPWGVMIQHWLTLSSEKYIPDWRREPLIESASGNKKDDDRSERRSIRELRIYVSD